MCGIVGFCGKSPASEVLIKGLKQLEYRGYDSAGVALQNSSEISTVKTKGKVQSLESLLQSEKSDSTTGIGHTRWATHGIPDTINAHPHTSCHGEFAVVHNGIIENFAELKDELLDKGHEFSSSTDSEVIAHLIEECFDGNITEALRLASLRLIGSWGIAAISATEANKIAVARKDSPLIICKNNQGCYIASDTIALLPYSRDVFFMEDYEVAECTPESIKFFDHDGTQIEKKSTYISWDIDVAEKGGYPDFMLKEIHEQPRVIRDTLLGRFDSGHIEIDELNMSHEELALIDQVFIIACGTSYHAGLIAKNLIEGWARIPVQVDVASEFRYRDPIITPTTLVVAISQSGETADTLAALRDARVKGARVFAITNIVGSPIARESDGVIYTKANKEIAVASTKSFLGQVVSTTLLALFLGQVKGELSSKHIQLLYRELGDCASLVEEILSDTALVSKAAASCKDAQSALFIGRGMGSAIAYEGALKLKEISYLHAEAYAAGEMKHGPIALLDEGFPVIAIATQGPIYDKTISNLQECKARGAKIVAIATLGDEDIKELADFVIYIPQVRESFLPILASVPLQLFAREIALLRGCDVDQPRNLAKSVTVE